MADHPQQSEGFLSLIGGQDAGTAPDLIGEQMFARGVNVSTRGGLIRTRDAFVELANFNVLDESSLFKGGFTMRRATGDLLFLTFGVNLYVFNVLDNQFSIFEGVLQSAATRHFFCQADDYVIIQDDLVGDTYDDATWPLIFQGSTNISDQFETERGTDPQKMLPKGQMMAFGHNRIFVVVDWVWDGAEFVKQSRRSFIACDIYQAWNPANVLRAEENLGANAGAITLSAELGEITGMAFQRNVESGTGHGPLIAFARYGASTYRVDLPRSLQDGEDWSTSQFGRILYQTTGLIADKTISSVNNDLILRATDGIRSVRYTVAEANAGNLDLSVEPISREVEIWQEDLVLHQPFASAAWAGNRYLCTALHKNRGSETIDEAFAWDGLISMDTSPTAKLGNSSGPVYDGLYTGLKFQQVLSATKGGKTIQYIVAQMQGASPGVWTLRENSPDQPFDAAASYPECQLHTRLYYFGSLFSLKQLDAAYVILRHVKGPVTITLYYRADGHELWKHAGSGSVMATGDYGGRTRPIQIPFGNAKCDPSGAPLMLDVGNGFQFALKWTGVCTVAGVHVTARLLERTEATLCEELVLVTNENDDAIALQDTGYLITA